MLGFLGAGVVDKLIKSAYHEPPIQNSNTLLVETGAQEPAVRLQNEKID